MAFAANNKMNQIGFSDSLNNLTERETKFLKKSWAEGFAQIVFPAINEERFSVLYSDTKASRPNTPVNVIIGLLILKEMHGLTDEELVEGLLFNLQYQYALHTTSDNEQPISDRTLSRFRARLYNYEIVTGRDLIHEEIEELASKFAELMKINPSIMRMDSVMISSGCRRLSRLSLIYRCIQNMSEAIKKSGHEEMLGKRFTKYLKSSEHDDIGYRLGGEEAKKKMSELLQDALGLLELCKSKYYETDEFRQLKRMLKDQSDIKGGRIYPKDGKDISPASMQNPSDEEATYRKKNGKGNTGYVGNIVETCDEEHGNLITEYDLQPNQHSDLEFTEEVLSAFPDENDTDIVIADGAYGSLDMQELAESKGIELVSSSLVGGISEKDICAYEFEIDDGEIKRCPEGHEPIDSKREVDKGESTAHFNKIDCEACPNKDRCPIKIGARTATVKITDKALDRASYADKLNTDKYRELGNKRNGVEGVPSVLRRKYGIDRLTVRGQVRSKMSFGFKIGAINVERVLAAVSFLSSFINSICNSDSSTFRFKFARNLAILARRDLRFYDLKLAF
jgi:hypothetical protein